MSAGENLETVPQNDMVNSTIRTIIICIAFIAASPVIAMPVVVGAMVDTLGITPREAGFVVAMEMTGAGLSALFLSARIHIWDRRRIVYAGLGAYILMNLVSLFMDNWQALAAVRFMAGLTATVVVATVKATLAKTADPDRSFGLYIFLSLLYAVAVLPTVSFISSVHGLSGIYLMFIAAAGVGLLLTRFFPAIQAAGRKTAEDTSFTHLGLVVILLAAVLVYFIGQGAVWTYVERIGVSMGISIVEVGSALGVAHVFGGAGAACVFAMGNRFGRLAPVIAGVLLVISSVAALLVGGGYGLYIVAVCAFAFAVYFTIPYFFGLMSQLDRSGRVVVLGLTVQAGGMALGPALAGGVIREADYSGVELLGGGCFAASLVLLCLFGLRFMKLGAAAAAPAGKD